MKAQIWTDQNWNKFRVNPKRIHEYINCRIEYREVTEEEIVELWIPEAMVTVLIPIEVFMQSELLQKKVMTLDLLFNWLDRRTMNGFLHIENIDTHDVPAWLSMEEYQMMKSVWVIFPPEIIALYENTENEQNNNEEETEPTEETDN